MQVDKRPAAITEDTHLTACQHNLGLQLNRVVVVLCLGSWDGAVEVLVILGAVQIHGSSCVIDYESLVRAGIIHRSRKVLACTRPPPASRPRPGQGPIFLLQCILMMDKDSCICKAAVQLAQDTALTQVVDQSTRGNNILDLLLTNRPSLVNRLASLPPLSAKADHNCVLLSINTI